ncbi:MAG: flippase-like domain-containing protein [Planctomycetota bacterium]|nr:flippase-like domain-containing protein [Planctomycetota bacterium]
MPQQQATVMTPDSPALRHSGFFARYFWVIAKNAVGWVLIFSSILIAGVFPGPLGTPMFLIGFAMITFPGKRHMTSRFLRGMPINPLLRPVRVLRGFFSLLLPALVILVLSRKRSGAYERASAVEIIGLFCVASAAAWLGLFWLLRVGNLVIALLPRVRRRVRPWLKRRGINLLPPRYSRRKLPRMTNRGSSESILEIDAAQIRRVKSFWDSIRNPVVRGFRFLGGSGKPLVALLIVAGIVKWMFRPVLAHWHTVHDRVLQTSPFRFVIASAMFALFLFVFRVFSWRKIIAAFGFKLPLAASARIWSSSELARYLPGIIWQVWGRVYLARPYGVTAAACSTSQVLELAIFLMANLLVALACLPWFLANLKGPAQHYFWLATALAPVLLLLLIPSVFYGRINTILRWLKKPPIQQRLSGLGLLGLLSWAVIGLCWQGLAIWLLLGQPQALGLRLSDLPLVIGAYCLAWCAGFIVVTAPGGIGVRELVLVWALRFALPVEIRQQFSSAQNLNVVLFFLAVLLRLWTIAGELMLSATAHLFDFRGALGQADAPGRIVLIDSLPGASMERSMPAGVAGETRS